MDRVLNINPENVLAYFNRASIFIEMERWEDALEDYDRAIELYPDFAKAYMNRSYVKSRLGLNQSSKEDYRTAQRKIQEYRARNVTDEGSFADTTRKYSSLIALFIRQNVRKKKSQFIIRWCKKKIKIEKRISIWYFFRAAFQGGDLSPDPTSKRPSSKKGEKQHGIIQGTILCDHQEFRKERKGHWLC